MAKDMARSRIITVDTVTGPVQMRREERRGRPKSPPETRRSERLNGSTTVALRARLDAEISRGVPESNVLNMGLILYFEKYGDMEISAE